MNNDFLRFSNENLDREEGVVSYSAQKTEEKPKRSEKNTAIKIILEEIYNKDKTISLSNEETNNKPKLLISIVFSMVGFVFCGILTAISSFSNELFTLPILVMSYSLLIPISFTFFFYKLNIHSKVKFVTVMLCYLLGSLLYFGVELIFSLAVSDSVDIYYSIVAVKCFIELFSVFIISISLIKSYKISSVAGALLIACSVASGYSVTKSLSQNFSALLVNVSVGSSGETVGAIINLEKLIQSSIKGLIKSFPLVSVFKPCIFICLSVITVKFLRADIKSTVTSIFTFLFCLVTYVLISINTPFNYLTTLYNLLSIIFTVVLFIDTVNSAIK